MKQNKIMKENININNNYIHFKGKYIIYKSNIKFGGYYDENDKLFFEGEYLNKEKNGTGKEYDKIVD